jgi:hypothetical protein
LLDSQQQSLVGPSNRQQQRKVPAERPGQHTHSLFAPPTSIFDKMTGTRDYPARVRSKPVRYTETGVTPPIARGVKGHSKQAGKNAAAGSVGDIGGPAITDVASCPTSGCFKYKSGGEWKLKNQLDTDVVRNFKRSCLDYDQKKVRLLTEVISAEEESPVMVPYRRTGAYYRTAVPAQTRAVVNAKSGRLAIVNLAGRASALPALRIRHPFMEHPQTPTETVTGQLTSS